MKQFSNIKETDIFIRHFAHETSAEEEAVVSTWQEESQENKDYVNYLQLLWDDNNDKTALDQKFNTLASLDKIKDAMKQPSHTRSRSLYIVRWSSIAASILLLIGLGIYYLSHVNKEITIVSNQKIIKISLPDASIVWLNRNSELIYNKNYNKKRSLKFSGEGYFEVRPNASNPFEIITKRAKITVLGTKFNVNAPNDSTTEVVVKSGKVLLSQQLPGNQGKRDIILCAGEKGVDLSNTDAPQKVPDIDPNYLSWKTHEFTFNNTNIKDIVTIINKIYDDAHIELETNNTENCNLSGKFNCQSIEDILDMLRIVLNLKIEKNGKNITIKSAGC